MEKRRAWGSNPQSLAGQVHLSPWTVEQMRRRVSVFLASAKMPRFIQDLRFPGEYFSDAAGVAGPTIDARG